MKCINPGMYCFCSFATGNHFMSLFGKGCRNLGLITRVKGYLAKHTQNDIMERL